MEALSQSQLQLPGGVLQDLLNKALDMIQRARKSRNTRRVLQSTLEDLSPLRQEIKHYNHGLDRPSQDIEKLLTEMEEEEQGVVRKSAKICCNSRSLSACCDKLQREDSVVSNMNGDMSAQMAEDVKDTLSKMRDTLAVLGKDNSDHKRDFSGPQIKGMCAAEAENKNAELFTIDGLVDLEDEPIIKECFKDLGLFPQAQGISVAALNDMWAELYQLDDDGKEAMAIISKFASKNFVNLTVTRRITSDMDNDYNNHFITQPDDKRELAIYDNNQDPLGESKRLIIDMNGNNHQWHPEEKQQGMFTRILSLFPKYCAIKSQQHAIARTLSITADENLNSDWCSMEPNEAEVLILNLSTNKYYLPELLQKMSKLKVLIIKNSGLEPCELNNSELLGSLSNLKRIRMEKVSVPSLAPMKNLQKLSLYMCDTSHAFENSRIPIKEALPNLVDLNIHYCKDFVELPADICEVTTLKKLSVTNCHKFRGLPPDIGKLENLELLRLCCCSDLVELPESITRLHKLRLLDISYCISLCKLPEDIDELEKLRKLYMTSCSRCELPDSTENLVQLEVVVCDEETAVSWEAFKFKLPNLKIEVPQIDVNLNWLYGNGC